MEKEDRVGCPTGMGELPAPCASLAFPYIAMQNDVPAVSDRREALQTGTLFPGLDLPFKAAIQARTKLPDTALVELMAVDFAVQELGLYLTTHPTDREALGLYQTYIKLAREGRELYRKKYGPLTETDLSPQGKFDWLKDPWPWNLEGNE
ncbi:MAG: spore coat protein CotJB [Oscillibacter sp.]|nr:spore coat protein CotJB [Oscillibacter sp.]